MRCPKCGKEMRVIIDTLTIHDHCDACAVCLNHRKALDPAVLRELIEGAIVANEDYTRIGNWECAADYAAGRYETLVILRSFLSGDEKPLRKLAGE